MAAMVALSPSIVERTSTEPHIRHYYGDALLQLPGPEQLRNSIMRVCCCTGNRSKQRDLPLITTNLPKSVEGDKAM